MAKKPASAKQTTAAVKTMLTKIGRPGASVKIGKGKGK